MSICFGSERWDTIREIYSKWWSRELDRPIVEIALPNREPGRPCPETPLLSQECCADFSIPVDALVDRLDWELSRYTYYDGAFPRVNLDAFGPGLMAAFLGAALDTSTGRVWFLSSQPDIPIRDLHFEYRDGNLWLERVKELCCSAMRRWQGQVLVGMPDLGGILDIVQTFLPGERLLLELYDEPGEVKRLIWEAHQLWHRYYSEIATVLQPVNPGYSDWSGIYSDSPSYIVQCDASYMIGPEMFKEFVLPEIAATGARLSHTIYHLDGTGQLPHLDMLLELPQLDGIQWVPGDGASGPGCWPDIRRKVARVGKCAQTFGDFSDLRTIIEQSGSGRGIHHRCHVPAGASGDEICRALAEFDAGA